MSGYRNSRGSLLLLIAWVIVGAVNVANAGDDDTLRIGITDLPASFGDPFRAVGIPSALVWQQVFDGLTEQDEQGHVAPSLALSWTTLDPLTWQFELRQGVRFSNGQPFDAAAAKRVFDLLATGDAKATIVANELRGVVEVETTASHTLILRTQRPDPILPNRLTALMMVDAETWQSIGRRKFALQPVGTGSYVVETWQGSNGATVLRANPFAWRRPAVPNAELYPLKDHASRFQAAISGQLHAAMSLRPEQLYAFRERGFAVHVDPAKQILSLAFDVAGHGESPIGDRRVRQALNYALDLDAISRVITDGTAPPAGQGASPGVFGFNPAVAPYPYDPVKARALLTAAGFPQGFSMAATVVLGTYANDVEIFQKIQQDLAAVGVDLEIQGSVFSDWIQQYVFGKWRTEAFSLGWNVSPYNDAQRPMEYFSCLKPKPFFCDTGMAEDIQAAATELDVERRQALLQHLGQQFHDEAPSLFLVQYGHIWAVAPDVEGFTLHDRVPPLHRLSLAQ